MKYQKTITLKDGRACTLRNGEESDGQALLELFILTHAQTDFLLSYPDEVTFTAEQEEQFLKEKTESENEIEILAELDGKLIGSAGVFAVRKAEKVRHRAGFGISVDKAYWGLGVGRALTEACIECARAAGYTQLELEAVAENESALALYESVGFVEYGRNPCGFRSRLSGWQPLVLMLLDLEGETTMQYIIRPEREADHAAVEQLIRESFWNVYRPGCSEHYVIHVLRDDPAFVKELDFVMEQDGKLIGQNMFMRTIIEADDGREIPVLTMGPICITPELKRQGYGKQLLDYSLEQAAAMGFGAVLFEGNIGFYGKSGFDYARKFGVRYHDLPEGADDSFFLCRELIPGYLDGVTGVYQTPQGYYVDDADVEAFDQAFPPKEKLRLPGQIF